MNAAPRTALAALALVVTLTPAPAKAFRLLDADISVGRPVPDLHVLPAAAPRQGGSSGAETFGSEGGAGAAALPGSKAAPGSLDFDLLPEPAPAAASPGDGSGRTRRAMLRAHQGIGLGLSGLVLATTVVGQLNYSDKFDAGPNTARYQETHRILAYSTLGAFAINGLIALAAPRAPGKRILRFDRVAVHELGMLAAAAGMVAQGYLGIRTRQQEGYLNQPTYAREHLAIGYATLAAMGIAVGAIVF